MLSLLSYFLRLTIHNIPSLPLPFPPPFLSPSLPPTEEDLESRLSDTEARLLESQELAKMLSVPPTDIPGADRQELLRLLDRRQHEIGLLSEEWKGLSAKLVSVSSEKSEFQTK